MQKESIQSDDEQLGHYFFGNDRFEINDKTINQKMMAFITVDKR